MPLVTWVMTELSLRPPARYWSRASFRSVFSARMTLLPPAWHAAQLPAKLRGSSGQRARAREKGMRGGGEGCREDSPGPRREEQRGGG